MSLARASRLALIGLLAMTLFSLGATFFTAIRGNVLSRVFHEDILPIAIYYFGNISLLLFLLALSGPLAAPRGRLPVRICALVALLGSVAAGIQSEGPLVRQIAGASYTPRGLLFRVIVLGILPELCLQLFLAIFVLSAAPLRNPVMPLAAILALAVIGSSGFWNIASSARGLAAFLLRDPWEPRLAGLLWTFAGLLLRLFAWATLCLFFFAAWRNTRQRQVS